MKDEMMDKMDKLEQYNKQAGFATVANTVDRSYYGPATIDSAANGYVIRIKGATYVAVTTAEVAAIILERLKP